jgi:diaminohydroxyphosphoribosylaminopyrimidine deaminase/5-amino-6-(5-phosphoribosylamino)uracil reductase
VGAVVVKAQRVVGEGYHRRAGADHAEVIALKAAGRKSKDATLYVTLEPCSTWGRTPPCTKAIAQSGVSRVVIGVRDRNPAHCGAGIRILRNAGIKVTEGVCAEKAQVLVAPFEKLIVHGYPFLTLKLGMSLDGKIADVAHRSRWITSSRSRAVVQRMRRRADAVLVGSGTASIDDPSLLPEGRGRAECIRVVADSEGRLPLSARILNDGHESQTLIATSERCSKKQLRRYEEKGATVWVLPCKGRSVSVRHLLRRLGREGVMHVLCEGGGELAASLIKEGLVDEYSFFVAPIVLGGRTSPTAVGGNGWRLKSCPALRFVEQKQIGKDLLLRAVPLDRKR